MNTKDHPGCGWVIELEELKKALPEPKQAELDRLVDGCSGGDGERIKNFLDPLMNELSFPQVETVWFFDDEGVSDDLESSQWYVSFDENDLFIITDRAVFRNRSPGRGSQALSMDGAGIAMKRTTHCQRCGTDLNPSGFCLDMTCPFSDHQQTCLVGWAGHPDQDPYPKDDGVGPCSVCSCGHGSQCRCGRHGG